MSKFNTTMPKSKTLTENLAGGQAYAQSNELALVSLLLTSFVSDQFYRTTKESLDELKKLISNIEDKEFVAKAAIFARDRFGMRSITHAIAGELSSYLTGSEFGKNFYDKIVVRVDDMMEILSYYLMYKTSKEYPKFPNALKKGFAKAFDRFDGYALGKYRGENKEVKLVDVVNIVHPIPCERNKSALESLIKGELKSVDTWESKLSRAGQISESDDDLIQLKSDAWSELILSKKIGYLALLRNLRNIAIQSSPETIKMACEILTDANMIKKSRVLPFRFLVAYKEILKLESSSEIRNILVAINKALDISVENVPKFDGETLVVMDVSSSMKSKMSNFSSVRVAEISSLFGAILAKVNNCDVMTFARDAQYKQYNPMDSVLTINDSFAFTGGATNFKSIFNVANKKYNRVLILSDMQGWVGYNTPSIEFASYKSLYNANPYVYSWDFSGYGSMQFPEQNVFAIAGFSEKVFDIIKLMETDKNALLNEIKSISL